MSIRAPTRLPSLRLPAVQAVLVEAQVAAAVEAGVEEAQVEEERVVVGDNEWRNIISILDFGCVAPYLL